MSVIWTKEIHPPWYRDVSPMRTLILGSFPPHPGKWAYPFYYPNRLNRFWKILADLAGIALLSGKGEDQQAVEERYAIMLKLEVGVQNLGYEINRKGKSALDTDIQIISFHDIVGIIETHPELERILLPGYSAFHSTARSFLRYLEQKEIETSAIGKMKAEEKFEIAFRGRTIECIILNSTSPASKISYEVLLEQFKRYLPSSEK
jgi:G:T/U-mismatch repair DNA glycosylase